MYLNSTCGLHAAWSELIGQMDRGCSGGSPLATPEVIKLPMPSGLKDPTPRTFIFQYNSSCPALLSKLDCKAISELVRALICSVNNSFSTQVDPEVILTREQSQSTDTKHISRVVVLGASIMGHVVPYLAASGVEIVDLSQPGWVPTEKGLADFLQKLGGVPREGTLYVLDLLSNSTTRFVQYDGSLALPVKGEGGGYHLIGEVTTIDDSMVGRLVTIVSGILKTIGDAPKVIVPPLPRHFITPCCNHRAHCTNRSGKDYGVGLLGGLTAVRKAMKVALDKCGTQNFWLLDGIGAISGHMPGSIGRPGNQEILESLATAFGRDGIHLSGSGLQNISRAIIASIKLLCKKDTAVPSVAGCKKYHWRGFNSATGSKNRPQERKTPLKNNKPTRTHPYHHRR